jgi:hypothetical protein
MKYVAEIQPSGEQYQGMGGIENLDKKLFLQLELVVCTSDLEDALLEKKYKLIVLSSEMDYGRN